MNAKNSLLALACGDSYGSHFEFEGLMGVKFAYSSLPDTPKFPTITDDTKMATILLKHYSKYRTIKEEILINTYKVWAKEDGDADGIGIHTKEVLLEGKEDKNSQGNGALMRNIPFGVQLIEDGQSFEDAVSVMNKESAITHSNEVIFMANRLGLDLACNSLKVLKKTEYDSFLQKLHQGTDAWVIHTLYIVIEALKKSETFLAGFKYIVSQGGDTDTNCAIFGAILGAQKDISNELNIDDFLDKKLQYKIIQT